MKPNVDPEMTVMRPTIPYDGERSASASFGIHVPSSKFFRFAQPSMYAQIQIMKRGGTDVDPTWDEVAPGDRIVFDAAHAMVRSIKVNINSTSLNMGYSSDNNLARLASLLYRTSLKSATPELEAIDELLHLPCIPEDVEAVADKASAITEKRIKNFARTGQGPTLLPIFLPFWPLGNAPVHAQLNKGRPEDYRVRVFGEHTQITVNMSLLRQSELVKYVRQLKWKQAGDKLELKCVISDIFLVGEMYSLPPTSAFMSSFRQFVASSRLSYPFLSHQEVEVEITKGLSESHMFFSPHMFDTRFFFLYFKTTKSDTESTTSHANVTDFAFPSSLHEIIIKCGEEHLACTPVRNVVDSFSHATKLAFFSNQMRNRRVKTTFNEFYLSQLDQYVVADLHALRQNYKQNVKSRLPDITFRLVWGAAKSPAGTTACIVSFRENRVDIDCSGDGPSEVVIV